MTLHLCEVAYTIHNSTISLFVWYWWRTYSYLSETLKDFANYSKVFRTLKNFFCQLFYTSAILIIFLKSQNINIYFQIFENRAERSIFWIWKEYKLTSAVFSSQLHTVRWSVKGSVGNQVMPSLHDGSLPQTLIFKSLYLCNMYSKLWWSWSSGSSIDLHLTQIYESLTLCFRT